MERGSIRKERAAVHTSHSNGQDAVSTTQSRYSTHAFPIEKTLNNLRTGHGSTKQQEDAKTGDAIDRPSCCIVTISVAIDCQPPQMKSWKSWKSFDREKGVASARGRPSCCRHRTWPQGLTPGKFRPLASTSNNDSTQTSTHSFANTLHPSSSYKEHLLSTHRYHI